MGKCCGIALVVVSLVSARAAGQPCDPAFRDQLLPTSTTENAYAGSAVAVGGGHLLVGAYRDETAGVSAGCVYAYKRDDNGFSFVEQLLPSGSGIGDDFGWSIDCDTERAVVGSPRDRLPQTSIRPGSVDVFQNTGSGWVYETTLYPSSDTDDRVGTSVSLSGQTLVIGAPEDDGNGDNSGAVHVYREPLSFWQYEQHLTASDASEGDFFGYVVDSTDTAIAVSAIGANGIGCVYTFEWSGAAWVESQILTPFDGKALDRFGLDLVLTDTHLFVGSDNDLASGNGSGTVYVYSRQNGQWVYETKLFADDGSGGGFGRAVGASGSSVVCGAQWASVDGQFFAGRAYYYHYDGASWEHQLTFSPDGVSSSDSFGASVALDGTDLVIGSTGNDAVASSAGAAYLYSLSCVLDCPADVNGDGLISPSDFTAWINAFNNSLPGCDQNNDGSCTATDFTAWIANYNAGC